MYSLASHKICCAQVGVKGTTNFGYMLETLLDAVRTKSVERDIIMLEWFAFNHRGRSFLQGPRMYGQEKVVGNQVFYPYHYDYISIDRVHDCVQLEVLVDGFENLVTPNYSDLSLDKPVICCARAYDPIAKILRKLNKNDRDEMAGNKHLK